MLGSYHVQHSTSFLLSSIWLGTRRREIQNSVSTHLYGFDPHKIDLFQLALIYKDVLELSWIGSTKKKKTETAFFSFVKG